MSQHCTRQGESYLVGADMSGLEWSTGSGTMWLLSRLNSLVSIEHHASWIRKVSQSLERCAGPAPLPHRPPHHQWGALVATALFTIAKLSSLLLRRIFPEKIFQVRPNTPG